MLPQKSMAWPPPPPAQPVTPDITATVNVIVSRVIPFGPTQTFTPATFEVVPNPAVTLVNGTRLAVSKRVLIKFVFSTAVTPKDLWFLQVIGSGDAAGKANLTHVGAGGPREMLVINQLLPGFRGARWKFWIPVEDVAGTVGLIDPELENTNEGAPPPP